MAFLAKSIDLDRHRLRNETDLACCVCDPSLGRSIVTFRRRTAVAANEDQMGVIAFNMFAGDVCVAPREVSHEALPYQELKRAINRHRADCTMLQAPEHGEELVGGHGTALSKHELEQCDSLCGQPRAALLATSKCADQ